MDESNSNFDYSYQDHSDLSGMLDTNRESSSEDEPIADDVASSAGSGSNATLVDNKENRTPLVGSTPGSRLSSTTQLNRKKDKYVNVSAALEKNKELVEEVYKLKLQLGDINRELPWIMVKGKDHIAEYIQFKNDNESLRMRITEYEKKIAEIKDEREQERERLHQEHIEEIAQLQAQYERVQESEPLPSPADMDRSMLSDGSSMWSERSRQIGLYELKVENLQKDVKIARNEAEIERKAAVKAQKELDEMKREMEEKEKEWKRRESIASLQETFHIGIAGRSNEDMRKQIDNQLSRIDKLEKELKEKCQLNQTLTQTIRNFMQTLAEKEKELQIARESNVSMVENGEIDDIMRELQELSEMNSQLQEECRRRGANREGRKKEGEKEGDRVVFEEIKKELDTTTDICEQYQKMGDRLAPLHQRIIAMNKSVMERRSFAEGLKGFEVSGLTPLRERSNGSGTPGTPIGRGTQSRLLHSVLQKSLNVSHMDILSCSINTSQGIKDAKDKLVVMKDSCQRLFDKLKSSYALFDEIRLALGGEENEGLARQMEELRLDLEMSLMESVQATKAIQVVEESLFELQSVLENSIGGGAGRESDFNLSTAMGRVEGGDRKEGEEGGERRQEDAPYSIQMTAFGERQDAHELREQNSALVEENNCLLSDIEELKRSVNETNGRCATLTAKCEELEKERDGLYGVMEDRRKREETLLGDNQRLRNEVERAKEEIEEISRTLQDQIQLLESQVVEEREAREMELRRKEEHIETLKMSIEEKEDELSVIHGQRKEISQELDSLKEVEKRNEIKKARLDTELQSYKEQCERMTVEYRKVNDDLDEGKKREEEMRKKLQKYQYKAIVEEELIRKETERDQSSTQTSLTMEKLSRMEWSQSEMNRELTRLRDAIENAFLIKEHHSEPQRVLDEMEVSRLVDIVERGKIMKDENNHLMQKTNRELKKYVEEKDKDESRAPSSEGHGRERQMDSYTSVGGVKNKYQDPIRQLFYSLTHAADTIVQSYKKALPKMVNGELSEAECNHILQMLRDLRTTLNDKFSQCGEKMGNDAEAGDARMALRMAVVMEANEKLKSRVKTLMTALRSNWSDEERAKLLEKVVTEMGDITSTLKKTVGVHNVRLPSSSNATASTRKK